MIHSHDLPRLPPGQMTELLRALTASPVQNLADLPRAAQEARQFNSFNQAMKDLGTTATP